MKQSWQLINRAWIPNEYHRDKVTEWIGETKNVLEWWSDLFHGKQMLAIKHRIIVCVL